MPTHDGKIHDAVDSMLKVRAVEDEDFAPFVGRHGRTPCDDDVMAFGP